MKKTNEAPVNTDAPKKKYIQGVVPNAEQCEGAIYKLRTAPSFLRTHPRGVPGSLSKNAPIPKCVEGAPHRLVHWPIHPQDLPRPETSKCRPTPPVPAHVRYSKKWRGENYSATIRSAPNAWTDSHCPPSPPSPALNLQRAQENPTSRANYRPSRWARKLPYPSRSSPIAWRIARPAAE